MNKPFKRIIVGVISCDGHEDRRQMCRKTWLAELISRPDVEVVFVVGNGESPWPMRDGDLLRVPCPDDSNSLSSKVRALAEWAIDTFEFSYLFKCEDDTYISVPRLLRLDLMGREYVGSKHHGYAQGGAGYFLSRRATSIVVDGLKQFPVGREDYLVGQVLSGFGISCSNDWRFRQSCRNKDQPRAGNMIVTCHGCRPVEMMDIHRAAAPIAKESDATCELFVIRSWSTDYGMLGLDGQLGFEIGGRSEVSSPVSDDVRLIAGGCQFISAHANSEVVLDIRRPVEVIGFMDGVSGSSVQSPVQFVVDREEVGSLDAAGARTRELYLPVGKHSFRARCRPPAENLRCCSVWAIRPHQT